MPNINLDDAYILDETGAQVDKVTGLFTKDEDTTSGEKAFAQLNIGTAGSNRNLLDNPFFRVNQRDFSSSTANGLTVDRWRQYNCNTAVRGAGGLRIRSTNGGTFCENCPYDALLIGSTVTISVMYADGTVDSGAVVIPSSGTAYTGYFSNGARLGITVTGTSMIGFQMELPANADISVYAFKWELGSVSTLANDAPPDYGEELRKCQRYLRAIYAKEGGTYIGVGMGTSTNIYTIEFPFSMRATPTPSLSGTIDIYAPSGMHTVSSVAAQPSTTDTICLNFTVNGTVSVYEMGHFNIYNNTRLLLSAEL